MINSQRGLISYNSLCKQPLKSPILSATFKIAYKPLNYRIFLTHGINMGVSVCASGKGVVIALYRSV